ncbi:hypothetical protein BCR41DRAFT_398792 [Lobosporangium transversale]|uniref:P-loop containing nucleoside triphosphate hydrolase protein n=1 Tax=Lobosporangium transversale TaxID=64571 RepID=A0A1Y2GFF6_9FUNG|nr:hypothetical protein BCR41DRAFT_398792 [Lobosporangium transversale]ORZ09350.1 hypothetical protein BCR41DRAFT_398792 [Lobosporangium transversale]|eukprot:XP_021878803.1 hypothetical protein BCR41DRAFT_398792 [Lobosporangium transversale]
MALNTNEHRFEVRSSDYLFLYYLVTLLGSLLSLFILNDGFDIPPLNVLDVELEYNINNAIVANGKPGPPPIIDFKLEPLRYLLAFTGSIALAFFFEALPRGHTRVQRVSREQENLSRMDQANLFSRLIFHYAQPMMSLGARKILTPKDVEEPMPAALKTHLNYEVVSAIWERRLEQYRKKRSRRQKSKNKDNKNKEELVSGKMYFESDAITVKGSPSLILTVLYAYKWRIFSAMAVRLLSYTLWYVPIYLFSHLLRLFADYSEARKEHLPPPAVANGILISVGIFAGTFFSGLFLSMSSNACSYLGIEIRGALVAMIYRKSLKLSPHARSKSTLGEISNLMAVDAESWMVAPNFLPLTLTIPFEIAIAVFLLYRLLGWSLVAGLAVFAIIMPIQTKMAGLLHSHQREKLKVADKRLGLMTEILANIKIVKLQAWEDAFHRKIDSLRSQELGAQRALATVRAFLVIVFSSAILLIALATFSVYAYWGGPGFTPAKVTPEIVFVGIALFTTMSRPMGLVPQAISHVIMLRSANGRIRKFLLLEEIDSTAVERYSPQDSPAELAAASSTLASPSSKTVDGKWVAVEIENGTFTWERVPEKGFDVAAAATTAEITAELPEEQAARQPLLGSTSQAAYSTFTSSMPARPTLMNITVQIPRGHLTAIVGRIGQGKSSMLSAIIGEMYKLQGAVRVFGNLAYVPQQAWIINATLRDNVLFGKPFIQDKYDHIIMAAGLIPDIEMLPAGDSTEIGERGINLSGGQKQRIALARAAYQDADIYLLDDPLSAVDAHVDQHLWQHLIGPNGLLKDKTRLLVTHGIHHLEYVDQIIVLNDGRVTETGEYQELMRAKEAFYQLITDYSVQEKKKQQAQLLALEHEQQQRMVSKSNIDIDDTTSAKVGEVFTKQPDDAMEARSENGKAKRDTDIAVADPGSNSTAKPKGDLIGMENLEVGNVGWGAYWEYAKAISLRQAFICLFLYTLAQGCQISTSFWLRYWVTQEEDQNSDRHSTTFYLCGYALLVAIFIVMDVTVSYMTNVTCGIQGAKALHDGLLVRVLRMPMSFFDTTPMGRIVNRFSSDVTTVDSELPAQLPALLGWIFTSLGIIVVIAFSTPQFLIAVTPLAIIFFTIQSYYIRTSSQLKRFQSAAKSPLYQHFSESLAGVSIIRCQTGLVTQFIIENERRSDSYAQASNLFLLTTRWLTIRTQVICALAVFLTAALAVLNADRLDPSLVGLALSYALNLSNVIAILVRTSGDVQNQFVSVERIQEYSHKPTEAPLETHVHLPEDWPSEGKISFNNFSARYREGLDLCIKHATFTVEPQQKVGVVGRTGAGKSSLTLALFRLIEAADSYWAKASDPSAPKELLATSSSDPLDTNSLLVSYGRDIDGGVIAIDGVDISTLGLRDLRRHLSIIPQEPTLFAGTIRDNLDPFHELEDADLWEALDRAHLKGFISSLAGGLSSEVAQNGDNFSFGQRALVCLARALLKKTKILVLDEATAAVDVETDEMIQRTIREAFKDRTVITIAHRIKTVMDSDMILVMEQGRVKEYGPPKELLRRRDVSLFYKLAEQAGEV